MDSKEVIVIVAIVAVLGIVLLLKFGITGAVAYDPCNKMNMDGIPVYDYTNMNFMTAQGFDCYITGFGEGCCVNPNTANK